MLWEQLCSPDKRKKYEDVAHFLMSFFLELTYELHHHFVTVSANKVLETKKKTSLCVGDD